MTNNTGLRSRPASPVACGLSRCRAESAGACLATEAAAAAGQGQRALSASRLRSWPSPAPGRAGISPPAPPVGCPAGAPAAG
eukprot:scaffold38520_cov26-Prasinocladus_malaysianus.AAC.1